MSFGATFFQFVPHTSRTNTQWKVFSPTSMQHVFIDNINTNIQPTRPSKEYTFLAEIMMQFTQLVYMLIY